MDIIGGILAGIGGAAGVWAILHFAAPYLGRLAGRILKIREDMDADSARIVANLRLEIGDYERRQASLIADLAAEQTKNAVLAEQLADCDDFIKRYIGDRK